MGSHSCCLLLSVKIWLNKEHHWVGILKRQYTNFQNERTYNIGHIRYYFLLLYPASELLWLNSLTIYFHNIQNNSNTLPMNLHQMTYLLCFDVKQFVKLGRILLK